MRKKNIYESKPEDLYFYSRQILWLGIIGYAALHFNENPPVVMVVIVIVLFFMLGSAREVIIIRDDGFAILSKRVLPVLTTSREFLYDGVEHIEADLPSAQWRRPLADIITGTSSFSTAPKGTIAVKYKVGHVKKLETDIDRAFLITALDHIRRLSRIEIEINEVS